MFFTPETRMRALRNEIERRAASKSRADSATRQNPSDKQQPPAALTHYQSLRPTSLLFNARVERGRVLVDESAVGKEMARHLNQAHKHYEADSHGADDSHALRFTDEKRSVFHLQSTAAVAAVLKSSRSADATAGRDHIPDNPGRAQLGYVSGVHTTADGRQYRLANERLFRFEPQVNTWLPDADGSRFHRIGLTREGELLKVPFGTVDSSAEGKRTVSLNHVEGVNLLHLTRGSVQTPVDEAGEPVHLTHIGLAGDTLYAGNIYGELLRGSLAGARDGVLPMVHQPVESLELALKGAVSVEGFLHDDQGQLNALVRDSRQQMHSCPLTGSRSVLPEWNLSDVLVKGIEKGLPQPSLQALAGAVDLGQRGRVALDAEHLLSWDASTQRWQPLEQKAIAQLAPGLDGRAYVLQDGQLKAVATQRVRPALFEGASHELAPVPGPRTQVTLNEVLAGNAQRRIAAFAVADAKAFVTLDSHQHLRAHVAGDEIALSFTRPEALQALAMDHTGALYAQSNRGDLLRLDKQAWQGAPADALSWTKVRLPDDQRLESLRMGPDKHLIASWNNCNFRLSTSPQGALEWGPLVPGNPAQAQPLGEKLRGYQPRMQFPGGALTSSSNVLGQSSEGIHRERGLLQGLKAHFHPLDALRQTGLDVQHHFGGRRGLEDLYADDKRLREALKPLAQMRPASQDIASRLQPLGEPGPRQQLAADIGAALTRVEKNAQAAALRLGEAHGYRYMPGPGSSSVAVAPDSVLPQLLESFKRVSPSSGNPTVAVLRSFEGQGLELPVGSADRKRDSNNRAALIEKDLIHHASTLKQLGDLVAELEHSTAQGAAVQAKIGQSLEALMQAYDNSPVHRKVAQNIHNYAQAEKLYDNFKLLAKDLGTPGSALHWHITQVLGLPASASIKEKMTDEVLRMDSGQTLASSRAKGVNLGMMLTGVRPVPTIEFFVGLSKASTSSVSISRTDTGARVEIGSDATRRLAASVAGGVTLGSSGTSLRPGLRLHAELTAAVARSEGASIGFNVKEADFPKMMAILTGEHGDVYDLLDLGERHTAGAGSKTSADLNLDAFAQLRGMYNPKEDIERLDSVVRAGMGVVGNLNLAHWERSEATARSLTDSGHTRGSDVQFLRQGGIGVNFAPLNSVVLGHLQVGEADGAGVSRKGPSMAGFALPEVSATVSFDRGHSHTFSFSFKSPAAVTQAQVDGVAAELSRYSPQFRRDLASLELTGQPVDAQLGKLKAFMAAHPPLATKPQPHAQISQALEQLIHQNAWVGSNLRQLSSVEASVTRVGLRGNERHEWLDDVAAANKAAIVQWFKEDPHCAQLLNELELGKGTSVSLGLEVKPDVLRGIESACARGEKAQEAVKQALSDPDNLRIKSMSLSYKATQSHGMSLPTMTNLSFSSKAVLSHAFKTVNVDLEYGADPDKPLKMNMKDVLARSSPNDVNADWADLNVKTPGRLS